DRPLAERLRLEPGLAEAGGPLLVSILVPGAELGADGNQKALHRGGAVGGRYFRTVDPLEQDALVRRVLVDEHQRSPLGGQDVGIQELSEWTRRPFGLRRRVGERRRAGHRRGGAWKRNGRQRRIGHASRRIREALGSGKGCRPRWPPRRADVPLRFRSSVRMNEVSAGLTDRKRGGRRGASKDASQARD